MGVNSLWDIIGPTARPVRLESLSRKKLAVDASIWIYQFLKAVRDSDGNSLPQSHIVGFFRRICKLLYFGILPVFVFDGGAPALKRKTIMKRRERRQGQTESTLETAKKLLAIEVQKLAERQSQGRPTRATDHNRKTVKDKEDDTVYLEDLQNLHPNHQTPSGDTPENPQESQFRRKDEYHLPKLEKFRSSLDDGRIMPEEEFLGELDLDSNYVDGVDINTVDPASPEFAKLPLPTQYMILSHLRLRSRLRMGFSKEQLESLFPNSMDFSKFQIREVQKRNFFTQRLMDVSGMGENGNTEKRIAGDKDRKYALTRIDNGWVLKLQGEDHEGTKSKPIDLDFDTQVVSSETADLQFDRSKGQFHRKQKTETRPRSQIVVDKPKLQENDSDVDEDDDDLDLEDIPLKEEDENILKAMVQSIYSQYSRPETDQADGKYENDLRKAIEKSKNELKELKRQEIQSTGGIFNWNNNFDSEPNVPPLQNKRRKHNTSEKKEFDPTNISFGKTFLSNDDEVGDVSDKKIPTRRITTENHETAEAQKIQLGDDIRESDDDNEDENDRPEPRFTQEVPTWFNEHVSTERNPFEDFKEHEDHKSVPKKVLEDVAAGLIPWNEAKEMYSDEIELELESDIEIIDTLPQKENPPVEAALDDKVQTEEVEKVKDFANSSSGRQERQAQLLDYDFEQEDEEKLLKQMRDEDADHETLKKNYLKAPDIPISSASISDEQLLQEQYQKAKRDSDEVTETMIRDVQELLKRFGIPYITAPMEAEAQCAELMKLGLVDGIITDDSDCFLFGGQKVYKNMFNQKHYVECYFLDEVKQKIGLNQENLIEMALLLGSDYTEGIKGIGPVLAVEILAEFTNLKNFKTWLDRNSVSIPDKENMTSLKKSLLNKVKNGKLFLPDSFPDKVVFDAYISPEVDKDTTEFKWGVPNLDQIRSFLMYNVGWSQGRVDEVMVPLIQDMNRKKLHGTQSTIGEFFPHESLRTTKELAMGNRLKKATQKLQSKSAT